MKRIRGFIIACCILGAAVPLHAAQESDSVETMVKTLTLDPESNAPVVILETTGDKKLLPIWIDIPEARAIALVLEKVTPPRPLTHDLIRNLLEALGAKLQRATIADLRNSTYFALLTLEMTGRTFEIDARPSDAIAVALRMKAPIYATAQVLAKAKTLTTPSSRGERARQKLGVQAQDLTAELGALLDITAERGVLLADVTADGAGANAGLQRGDIVIKADKKAIESIEDLDAVLEAAKVPAQINFEVLRKGKPILVVIEVPS